MGEFIGQEVEVLFDKKPGPPSAFTWKGTEYRIVEILGRRQVLDFKKQWWRRKHRDYYTVRTDSGEVFKLYFHRGPGRKYWVLRMKVE